MSVLQGDFRAAGIKRGKGVVVLKGRVQYSAGAAVHRDLGKVHLPKFRQ